MAWTPQLNITCARCGKPRGLRHVCVASNNRKATVKAGWSFGQCPKCRKTITNPLTHTCRPKSDFKRRRAAHGKRLREEAKARARAERAAKAKPKHDYRACTDGDCKRPLCVAFKTGHREGYERGFSVGWESGFPAGVAACPRNHQ